VCFSLKNHGADEDVEKMFDMGAETLDLPMEEKMKYERGDNGFSFGSALALGESFPLPHPLSLDTSVQALTPLMPLESRIKLNSLSSQKMMRWPGLKWLEGPTLPPSTTAWIQRLFLS
jgi:hypothetical protein